ncbi:DUF4350 domain-containing protein [Winogradskya consettensis]|uniref:DUF4350 domain-containing protein n=1 Tax=Winogradskya consettensis TaxID=113560 RepID=A0A919T280_9ACTN|nr:DUF4350 domain-containing protein [Actinoplanes consettensis]GIM81630.1 hypothetical protein Aco04nite_77540 [Actinoplanes consettensis]
MPRLRNPRRLRLIMPFAVVLVLVALTVIVHVVQQPDPTDASFLSPTSTAGDGARRLADDLTRDGVRIDVRSTSPEAIEAVGDGDAVTLLVTTPELVNPYYLERLALLPPRVRVVMVAPGSDAVYAAGLDVVVTGPRWTAAAPQPGCTEDFAQAGPAATLRWRYDTGDFRTEPVRCYSDSVVEVKNLTMVGAADPFRNDRADEYGNRALAVSLLSRYGRLIWLDLHEREKAPPEPTAPTAEPDPAEPTPDPDSTEPWDDDPSNDDGEPAPVTEDPSGQPGEQSNDGGGVAGSPLAQAFPPAVWATLALLLLAGIALALASARRLGTPVAEPLPVQVRAAETVRGLGGLYRRARARGTSLATVQAAARTRLMVHFGMPADSTVDEVAHRVAAQTGLQENEVRHLLGGGVEDSDEELARAASDVQRLVRTVISNERGDLT